MFKPHGENIIFLHETSIGEITCHPSGMFAVPASVSQS